MEERKEMYVTTEQDLWNSADEAHFFVAKGQVKPLPEITTPIIDDALSQGLLREATIEEMKKYEFEQGMEMALREGIIKVGRNTEETTKIYEKYLNDKKEMEQKELEQEMKKMPEEEKKIEEEPVAEPVEPEELEEESVEEE